MTKLAIGMGKVSKNCDIALNSKGRNKTVKMASDITGLSPQLIDDDDDVKDNNGYDGYDCAFFRFNSFEPTVSFHSSSMAVKFVFSHLHIHLSL